MPALWQLPWLRVSLIIKRLELAEDCSDDLGELLKLRAELQASGWFN